MARKDPTRELSKEEKEDTTMDRNTPTSPGPPHRTDPLKSEPIPSGFHELIQHNNNSNNNSLHPPPQQPYHNHRGSAGMESINVRSQPGSRYGTPVPPHGIDNNHYNNRAGSGQLVRGTTSTEPPLPTDESCCRVTTSPCTRTRAALTGPFQM